MSGRASCRGGIPVGERLLSGRDSCRGVTPAWGWDSCRGGAPVGEGLPSGRTSCRGKGFGSVGSFDHSCRGGMCWHSWFHLRRSPTVTDERYRVELLTRAADMIRRLEADAAPAARLEADAAPAAAPDAAPAAEPPSSSESESGSSSPPRSPSWIGAAPRRDEDEDCVVVSWQTKRPRSSRLADDEGCEVVSWQTFKRPRRSD